MYSRSSNEFKQNPRNRKNKETKNSKGKYKNGKSRIFEKLDKPKLRKKKGS